MEVGACLEATKQADAADIQQEPQARGNVTQAVNVNESCQVSIHATLIAVTGDQLRLSG